MTRPEAPPDPHDSFVAGLSFQAAMNLQRQIEAHPEIGAAEWWDVFNLLLEQELPPRKSAAQASE